MKQGCKYQIVVGPMDTDSYNIVHHPVYFVWAEAAIHHYFRSNPSEFLSITAEAELTIAGIRCKFNHPAKLYDELTIYTKHIKVLENGCHQFHVKIVNEVRRDDILDATLDIEFSEQR